MRIETQGLKNVIFDFLKSNQFIGNDEQNSICRFFRFGFKSGVLVRSTSYLGFKEVRFVTSIDEVVPYSVVSLFVSVIVGAFFTLHIT